MPGTIGNLTHLSEPIVIQLLILTALSGLELLISAAAIVIRLRIPDRRFLIQKVVRREGTYWVPHTPIIASLWIIAYSITAMAATLISLNNTSVDTRRALRIVALCLPFPVLCCVLLVSSGPIYAAHLFPAESVAAKWPRLGPALRFRPSVVNAVCHLSPVVFAVPAIGLSVAWSSTFARADEQSAMMLAMAANPDVTQAMLDAQGQRVADLYAAGYGIYRAQWAMWAIAFALPCLMYCAYQLVLLPVLLQEIDVLDTVRVNMIRLDHGAHLDQLPDLYFASNTLEKPPAASSRPSLLSRLSTDRKSWPPARALPPLRRTPSIRDEVNSFTRLELLRANTRLAILEAIVSSAFCLSWSAAKAALAPTILPNAGLQSIIFVLGVYLGAAFCLLSAILLLARGYNAGRVAKDDGVTSFRAPSGAIASMQSQARSFSQMSESSTGHPQVRPSSAKPTLEDVPASPCEAAGEDVTLNQALSSSV